MKYLTPEGFGKRISRLGMGVARFGTIADETLSFSLLDRFYAGGGTLLDTARNYYEWVDDGRGKSEVCIGKWMDLRGNREDMVISTKGGVRNEGHTWFYDLSFPALRQELIESMEALRTDNIDIYLLHRDEPDRPVEEIMETMQMLMEHGKITAIGVANWRPERIMAANRYAKERGLCTFSFIQTWWSLAEYTDAMWNDPTTTHMTEELYRYMQEHGLIGMAYTSQCKGYFKKAALYGLEAVDAGLKKRIETPTNRKKAEYIRAYAERMGLGPTAFVLGYITSNPLDGIALFSTMQEEHLKEILACGDVVLDEAAIEAVNRIKP
ncbi:aldo/keto reductase [Selenomonas sp. TAMA-11512]|uniref:aldo/keto reductase n=1 Tax=Selenomonas sp. TAMA-11512 TaxID=3095337 RepID=UPI003088F441|nr:aldo/keto reductase [Selenomonas sp. TAMA-11512]